MTMYSSMGYEYVSPLILQIPQETRDEDEISNTSFNNEELPSVSSPISSGTRLTEDQLSQFILSEDAVEFDIS